MIPAREVIVQPAEKAAIDFCLECKSKSCVGDPCRLLSDYKETLRRRNRLRAIRNATQIDLIGRVHR
jgi:hypothetical protein